MKSKFIFRRYICPFCYGKFFTKWRFLKHKDKGKDFEGLNAIVDDSTATYGSLKAKLEKP